MVNLTDIPNLLARFQPVAVYLFGSAAAGRTRPDSDVDVAVLFPQSITPKELFELQTDLAEALSCDVDLIDLTAANTVMRKEVLRTGRLIFEADRLRREEFEMYALSDYARLNEERAPVLAALKHPLPVHA